MNINNTLVKNDLNEIRLGILKLAYFDPTCEVEYGYQVLDYLILDVLSTNSPFAPVTLNEIKTNIEDMFKLEFAEEEISASTERLVSKVYIRRIVTKEGKNTKLKYMLLPNTLKYIQEKIFKFQELERKVINKWKNEIYKRYKDYPELINNIEPIISNLKLYISKMLIKHGIECIAIIYPDSDELKSLFKSTKSIISKDLSKINSFVDEIIKLEIPRFFYEADTERKSYIINIFNSSFYWYLIQVDESCSNLLREITLGQDLYLDTNVLLSLVGFDGPSVANASYSVLSLAKELGYSLKVTTKTVDEFYNHCKRKNKEYGNITIPSKELAEIAIKILPENDFLYTYWKESLKKEISIKDFIKEKSSLELLLKNLDIMQISQFRETIENSQELLNEMSRLRVNCPNKDFGVVEHDAFHRIFINKLRQVPKYHFFDAVAWFLTKDRELAIYDRIVRKEKNSLPFCLTIDQWVQFNRPLIKRTKNTKEYEDSFHTLLTTPFIRAFIPSSNMEKAYNKVLERFKRYRLISPKLALSIITDSHFMNSVGKETDEEKIEEKIDNKFVEKASQLEKKLEREKISDWIIFIIVLVVISILSWKIISGLNLTLNRKFICGILIQIITLFSCLLIPLIRFWKTWIGIIVPTVLLLLCLFW